MPQSIYGYASSCQSSAPCVYTPPPNQDVNVYLKQVNDILTKFTKSPDKDITIERLQTLNQLMAAVRGQATASS